MAKFNYLSQINTLQVIPLGSFEPLPPSKGDFFVSFLYLELTLSNVI